MTTEPAPAATEAAAAKTQSFEADVSRLLHLMVHSVYSERDIFVRELISNAADACEKLRMLALSTPELAAGDVPLRVVLSADKPWGWRYEGHHISQNWTIVGGAAVATSPQFFGSNPAEVREGPKKGLRVLGPEEDAARALLNALDAGQKAKAVIETTAPNDMITMEKNDIKPLSLIGISADALNASQKDLLMKLIDVYVGYMPADVAAERTSKLKKAGVEKIGFAWAGETERGKKHYYRVQGPTFLIEYDNTQNDGNHIHSVWRDFNGDFGRDLLREHLRSVAH